MSELKTRIKTAVVLAVIFAVLLALANYTTVGSNILRVVILILFMAGVVEYFVFSKSELKKYEIGLISLPVLTEISNTFLNTNFNSLICLILALFILNFVLARNDISKFADGFAKLSIPALYFGLGLSSVINLIASHEYLKSLISLVLVVIVTDSMAYFFGKKFGKNLLIPAISPGKTVEGTLGGVLAGLIVGVICFGLNNWFLALLLPVAAQTSDFVESYFKRINQVKDSSNLLPGHGGILDRIDGYFLAVPLLLFLM